MNRIPLAQMHSSHVLAERACAYDGEEPYRACQRDDCYGDNIKGGDQPCPVPQGYNLLGDPVVEAAANAMRAGTGNEEGV